MSAVAERICSRSDAVGILAQAIAEHAHAFLPGVTLQQAIGVPPADWRSFAAYWERLHLDTCMVDGGTYRLRRYGAFELRRPLGLKQLPQGPYYQSKQYNPLNGGIVRHFEPLELTFSRHPVLVQVVDALVDVLDRTRGGVRRWRVELHPYRILARAGIDGLPTPEGLHRDGVDFVASLLVRRENVNGGTTTITDNERRPQRSRTQTAPMDLVLADDMRVMHQVSALRPCDPGRTAFRDVLVLAFTAMP